MTLYHNGERNAKMDIVALKYDFFKWTNSGSSMDSKIFLL